MLQMAAVLLVILWASAVCLCGGDYVFKLGCGVGCTCYPDSLKMYCYGNRWTEIPDVKNYIMVRMYGANLTTLGYLDLKDKQAESIKDLTVTNSHLKTLEKHALVEMTELCTLDLSGNDLAKVHPDVLMPNISTIKSIDLSSNSFTSLPLSFLCSLKNSQQLKLHLGNNPYKTISVAKECLTNVTLELYFSQCHPQTQAFKDVTRETFLGFKAARVELLDLGSCSVKFISADAMDNFPNLNILDLSYNNISVINPKVFKSLHQLNTLSLLGNFLKINALEYVPAGQLYSLSFGAGNATLTSKDFNILGRFSYLHHLRLRKLTIPELSGEALGYLYDNTNLTILEISHCHINKTDSGAFNGSLTEVKLSHNSMTGKALGNYMFTSNRLAKSLKKLYLNINYLYEFDVVNTSLATFGKLKHLDFTKSYLRDFPFDILDAMPILEVLKLDQNFIAISPYTTPHDPFPSVKNVSLSRTAEQVEFPVKLLCLFPNATYIDFSRHSLDFLNSYWFLCENNVSLAVDYLDLTGNSITTVVNLNILKNLTRYILAENKIEVLANDTFEGMSLLKHLNISYNIITQLPANIFVSQKELRHLYMSNNQLEQLPHGLFRNQQNLSALDISSNRIQIIELAVLLPLKSMYTINLKHNVLECSCRTLPTYRWLYQVRVNILHIAKRGTVTCINTRESNKIDLLDFEISDYECDQYNKVITVVACTLGAYLGILLVAVLYRWRWYIRYQYFIFQAKVTKQREKELDSMFRFAAFVSFSKYDCEWVMDKLVPQIEEKHDLSLCLYNRNWFAGRNIIDYIVNSIDQSRRVLFIVSNHSAKSPWCCDEMSLARYRLLSERRDALLLVILERIHPSNMSPLLRHLMTSRVYIEWPRSDERTQREFWKSLVKSLSSGQEWRREDFGSSV